jgi:hypothetical protein
MDAIWIKKGKKKGVEEEDEARMGRGCKEDAGKKDGKRRKERKMRE